MIGQLIGLIAASELTPLTCIPEVALFVRGMKPALRFVFSSEDLDRAQEVFEPLSLCFASGGVDIRSLGNTWSSLEVPSIPCQAHAYVCVVARDTGVAEFILHSEITGDARAAGIALGYPRCCVEGCADLLGPQWASTLLRRSGDAVRFPCWANRLAIGWGGLSPIGEMYPCKLDCTNALEIGRAAVTALHEEGLERLASKVMEHALTPVQLDQDGGVKRATSLTNKKTVTFWS